MLPAVTASTASYKQLPKNHILLPQFDAMRPSFVFCGVLGSGECGKYKYCHEVKGSLLFENLIVNSCVFQSEPMTNPGALASFRELNCLQ